MPQTDYTFSLPKFKSTLHSICPWCSTYITKGSVIVKLETPVRPDTIDQRRCERDGHHWYWDGRPISMRPRSYVHYDCYKKDLILTAIQEGGCWYCESKDDLTIDHLKPTSFGGPDTPGNITVACRSCNSRKSTMSYDDFMMLLAQPRLF